MLGLEAATVARGRHELLSGQVLRERTRRAGGGRKPVERIRSEILNTFRALLAGDTAGDPMGRRGVWTGLRLRQISGQLPRLACTSAPPSPRSLWSSSPLRSRYSIDC